MPGPPWVSTAICANSCSDPTTVMIEVSRMVGLISGTVMRRKRTQAFAPSSSAAS